MLLGAFLPWLTLFAGLHPLRGIIGLNGRIIALGGAICLGAGMVGWLRPRKSARRIALVLGYCLTGFMLWLMVQQFILFHELRMNAMLVPRLGPGLFVSLAGALAVALVPHFIRRDEPQLVIEAATLG